MRSRMDYVVTRSWAPGVGEGALYDYLKLKVAYPKRLGND